MRHLPKKHPVQYILGACGIHRTVHRPAEAAGHLPFTRPPPHQRAGPVRQPLEQHAAGGSCAQLAARAPGADGCRGQHVPIHGVQPPPPPAVPGACGSGQQSANSTRPSFVTASPPTSV
jgi:hypothetical protein